MWLDHSFLTQKRLEEAKRREEELKMKELEKKQALEKQETKQKVHHCCTCVSRRKLPKL